MKIYFRVHAVQRMFERRFSVKQVLAAIQTGDTIEDYSSDMAEPGRLTLGFQGKRPLHVVSSDDSETRETIIITVYEPDPAKWKKDFKRRR